MLQRVAVGGFRGLQVPGFSESDTEIVMRIRVVRLPLDGVP